MIDSILYKSLIRHCKVNTSTLAEIIEKLDAQFPSKLYDISIIRNPHTRAWNIEIREKKHL